MICDININLHPFSTMVVFLKENFFYCGGGQAKYACLTCTPGLNSKVKKGLFPKAVVVFTTKPHFDVKRMYCVSDYSDYINARLSGEDNSLRENLHILDVC